MMLLILCLAAAAPAFAQKKPYPKPQSEFTAGQAAPDFVLKDQSGEPFQLSKQRGKWVLLYFYRGYW